MAKPNNTKLEEVLANTASTEADFEAQLDALGAMAGSGDNALPLFCILIAKAAKDGLISPRTTKEHEKAGDKGRKDDILSALERFTTARGLKSMQDRDKDSVQAQTSKYRPCARLGADVRFDGVHVLERAQMLMKGQAVALKSPAPSLTAVSNAQLASPTLLSDDEIVAAMAKNGPKEKTAVDDLKSIIDALEKTHTGRVEEPARQCGDARLAQAIQLVAAVLAKVEADAEADKARAIVAALDAAEAEEAERLAYEAAFEKANMEEADREARLSRTMIAAE